MDLDTQLQTLIEQAPQDGMMPTVMEKAIAPILKVLATPLQHREYYILQTLNQDWLLTTLRRRTQPEVEKTVLYAFAAREDALRFGGSSDPQAIAQTVPVTHILFQLTALSQVDSVVFFDQPGELDQGTEIPRTQLQTLIQTQLQKLRPTRSDNLPPNLA